MADNNPEVLAREPIPVEFYQWLYGIEKDVRVWDLTPNEIAGLQTALRAPAVSEEAVERVAIRRDVFDFLMGTGALGGYYFGESRPDMRGAFWWRTIMRATLSPTTPTEEPQS